MPPELRAKLENLPIKTHAFVVLQVGIMEPH